MKNFKKHVLFIAIYLSFLFLTQMSLIIFAQGQNETTPFLLTEPYLRFDAETDINAPLNVKGPISFIASDNLRGQINVAELSEDRSYLFPNLSGEICLSAGNCLISPQGSLDKLAKFTAQGLDDSSIQDYSRELSIVIDQEGNVGVGRNPEHKLHVTGRIQAENDVCTDLGGGICLSQVERPTSLAQATLEGEGTADRIPLWKRNYQLGDSEIYQINRNIGIGMNPSYKLDIAGTVRMLGFRLPVSPQEGYGLLSDDKGFGTWQPVLTPLASGRDIAEKFLVDPSCQHFDNCPQPGDLVSINEKGFIEKSLTSYDPRLIGIVSTQPAMTLGKELDSSQSRPVALIGQIPAKVSLENGSIEIGDALTSSFFPGIAQKATQPGRIIGIALESLSENDFQNCQNKISTKKESKLLDCEKRIGKINVLISLYNGF